MKNDMQGRTNDAISLAQFKHLFTGQRQIVDLTCFWLAVISDTEEHNSVGWRADLQVGLALGIVRPEA